MKNEMIQTLTNIFEGLAQITENGVEYWLTQDLKHFLSYTKLDNFLNVISKFKTGYEIFCHQIHNHFVEVGKMVELVSGSL